MDEATLRIKVEGDGAAPSGLPSPGRAAAVTPGQATTPPSPARAAHPEKPPDLIAGMSQAGKEQAEKQRIGDLFGQLGGTGGQPRLKAITEPRMRAITVAPPKADSGLMGSLGKALGGGAGGGGLGGIVAAAGPIAAVVGAVVALNHVIANTISSLGTFSAQLISPDADPSKTIAATGQAIKSVVGEIGAIPGAMLGALSQVMASLDGMVERFAQFSPGIAQAQAQAEMIQQLNDIRRASQATPDLVQYIRNRTELQQRIEDAKLRFMSALLPLVTKGMDLFEKILPVIEAGVKAGSFSLNALLESFGITGKQVKDIYELLRSENKDFQTLTDNILNPGGKDFPFFRGPEGRRANPNLGPLGN